MASRYFIRFFSAFLVTFIAVNSFAQNLIFTEDFTQTQSKTPPPNWSLNIISGSSSLDSFNFQDSFYIFPPPLSAPYALFDAYSGGSSIGTNGNALGEEVALESPRINTDGYNNLYLSFDYFLVSFANASLNVDVSTNGSVWTNVWSSSIITNTVISEEIDLASYLNNDSFQLRLRWLNTSSAINQGYGVFDNLRLYERDSFDLALISVLAPMHNACAKMDQALKIAVQNVGLADIYNAEITVNLSGANTSTFKDTIAFLAKDAQLNIDFPNINTSNGGVLNIKAHSTLVNDSIFSNDSLNLSVNILAKANKPIAVNGERCGTGVVNLSSSYASPNLNLWFADVVSGDLLDTGVSYTTAVISSNSTYFVASASVNKNSWSSYQGPWRYNGNPTGGSYLNVKANTDLILDSIFQLCAYSSSSTIVTIYAKKGSYQGSERTASAWEVVCNDTLSTQGWGKYISVDIDDIHMYKGEQIALYISVQGSASPTFKQLAIKDTTADLIVESNTINNLLFGAFINGYSWNGKIAYKALCSSERTAVEASILPRPTGAELVESLPFIGQYNTGNDSEPDIVSEGDTISYDLKPPTAYKWSNYIIDWTISDLKVETVNGTAIPASDTILPNLSSPGLKIIYTPSAGWEDSTILISLRVISNITSCDSIIRRYIYVAPTPTANFNFNNVCRGENTIFQNQSTLNKGTLSYKWYFGNGDSSDLASPIIVYDNHGSYDVRLIVTSDQMVVDDTIKRVEVYEIPQIDFSRKDACEGKAIVFNNQSSISSGSIDYIWDFGDDSGSTATNPSHLYAAAGEYTVKLVGTSMGCTAQKSYNVYQFASPNAAFTTLGSCQFKPIEFKNTSIIAGNESLGSVWLFNDGSPKATGPIVSHTFNTQAQAWVTLITASQFGCADTVTNMIEIDESPVADFEYDQACDKTPTQFTNLSTTPDSMITQYIWYFGDGDSSILLNPSHQYTDRTSYNVKLRAHSANGCVNEISRTLSVESQPLAAFDVGGGCSDEEIPFTNRTTNTFGSINFKWSFGDGDTSDLYSPRHIYNVSETTVYNVTLKASSKNGCFTQVSKAVQIGAIPNCFFTYSQSDFDRQLFTFIPEEVGYPSYTWLFEGDGSSNEIIPAHLFTYPDKQYEVSLVVSSDEGCSCQSTQYVFTSWGLGIEEEPNENDVVLYPNPTAGLVYIESSRETLNENLHVEVIDVQGKLVKKLQLNLSNNEPSLIDLSELNDGVYLLKIHNDQTIYHRRITVQH